MPHCTNYAPLNTVTEEVMGQNDNHNTQSITIAGLEHVVVAVRTNGRVLANGGNSPTASAEISRHHANLYTIARLSGLGDKDARTVFSALDHGVPCVTDVPCMQELIDGSWELIVRRGAISDLRYNLFRLFPGCILDMSYDPFEPNSDEVERLGYERAKYCHLHAFFSRATTMVEEALPVAGMYYQYLLDKTA